MLAGLAVLGLVYGVNSASFDGTRWEVAASVAAKVGGPGRVDGGFEWTDYHAGREVWSETPRRVRRRLCVELQAETVRPTSRDDDVVESASVWEPPGVRSWIVARRQRAC